MDPHPAYFADAEARRRFTRRMFDASAPDYDRVDRLLALGSGSWYRRQALLRAGLAPGDVVLVKASRAVGLERLALALTQEATA